MSENNQPKPIYVHIGGPVVLAYSDGKVRAIIPNVRENAHTSSGHNLFGGTMEEVEAKITELQLERTNKSKQ